MILLRKIRRLFSKREWMQLSALTAAMLFGSALEIFGVGLLLPLIQVVRDPQLLLANPRVGPWLQESGVSEPGSVVILVCSLFLALFVLRSVYLAGLMRVMFGFVYKKTVALSRRLLDAYLRTDYTFHLHRNTSRLIKNATVEVNNLVSGVVQSYMYLVSEVVVMLGLIAILLYTNPVAALTGFAVLGGIGFGFTALIHRRLAQIGDVRARQEAKMVQWVSQSLGGVKEIKVLGKEDYFVSAFTKAGTAYADAQRQNMLLAQYPRLAIETGLVLGLVGLVVVLLLAGADVAELVPVLALFGAASVRLIPSFTRLVTCVNSIRYYYPSVDLVHNDLMEGLRSESKRDRAIGQAHIEFERELRVERLTHRYRGSSEAALTDINLSIRPGQSVALVGPSGAGKTTLANLILGLLEPEEGRIMADGVDISANLAGWQKLVGYIPQDSYLLDDTLRRNVAFGVPDEAIRDDDVWKALELAQLSQFVSATPERLDALVGEGGARISGGQRQRIGIARALYHDPRLLVLDEATSALDQETERELQAAIFALLGAKTMIVIAHRLSTIRHCDVIHVLDKGRVAGSGTYNELIAESALFHQLVGEESKTLHG